MEYTISRLSGLSGVSTRTLRFYDEIGLLLPARVNSSGYRIYGKEQLDKLQQIMFFKELGFSLEEISAAMNSKSFDSKTALLEHRKKLFLRKEQLDTLIKNVNLTIDAIEGRTNMKDKEKFEGFKKKLVEDNERNYGAQVREKYGAEAIESSNKKVLGMSALQLDKAGELAKKIHTTLAEAFKTGDPAGETAQSAVLLHKEWLCMYWETYSKEAHSGVGQMYVDDERFTAYYDKEQPGIAKFLRDAINVYAKN